LKRKTDPSNELKIVKAARGGGLFLWKMENGKWKMEKGEGGRGKGEGRRDLKPGASPVKS